MWLNMEPVQWLKATEWPCEVSLNVCSAWAPASELWGWKLSAAPLHRSFHHLTADGYKLKETEDAGLPDFGLTTFMATQSDTAHPFPSYHHVHIHSSPRRTLLSNTSKAFKSLTFETHLGVKHNRTHWNTIFQHWVGIKTSWQKKINWVQLLVTVTAGFFFPLSITQRAEFFSTSSYQ